MNRRFLCVMSLVVCIFVLCACGKVSVGNENNSKQELPDAVEQTEEKDYDFRINELVAEENTATMDIEGTPIPIKYPKKWETAVQTEITEDRVKFSNNGTPLFDLVFTECDGYLLGTYKDTPIYIVDYEASADEQLAMQEDVNVILKYLMNDPDFKINN